MDKMSDTQEFDLMMVTTNVTPELGFGHGAITTESISDEEAQERAEELKNYLEDADPQAGCGCIDGRCVAHTLAGNEAKLGPKLAGGNSITMLFSAELNDYFQDDQNVLGHYARIVETLEDEGRPVRMHTDTTRYDFIQSKLDELQQDITLLPMSEYVAKIDAMDAPDGTACGMNDKAIEAFYTMSRLPKTLTDANGAQRLETEAEVDQRIAFLRTVTAALDPESFDSDTFERQIDRATQLHHKGFFDGWQSVKAALILAKVLHDRGSQESVLDRIDVLQASDKGVHGHIEWAVAMHKIPGKVLNTSRYYQDTGKQVLGVDLWAAEDNATAFATGPNADQQKQPLYQGAMITQAAGYVSLCDGSQRVVVLAV